MNATRLAAVLAVFTLLLPTAVVGSQNTRSARRAGYKALRIQGRNASGRPFLMALYHGAKTADNVTANLRVGRIIGDIIFTPFRH